MRIAKYFKQLQNNTVQCCLCPHNCIIKNGSWGICKVRTNIDGQLFTQNYAKVAAINLDPIEKKPLYHFYPGSNILSVGTFSCNLKCKFCQNHNISQSDIKNNTNFNILSPEKLINLALKNKSNIGIAYTYNEPTIWYEYVLDSAKLAHKYKLKNVMITNGFINTNALNEILPYIDAFNVDLKAFNNNFYKQNATAFLEPVLRSIKTIYESGKHLEITHLVINGLNDNIDEFKEMIKWLIDNTSSDIPLHISRYFPSYKYNAQPTRVETIKEFILTARQYLSYVYAGNINIDF